jgi:dihydroorotate dehydrogenase (NAD+) catalytic subunit
MTATGAHAGPVTIGSVTLANPVMTASGTAGYGTELAGLLDFAALGAVVVKSLAHFEWAGNPAPRLRPTTAGMLNAVGLQGPGVAYWLDHVLPDLLRTGATVVASIWGRGVDDYARAADLLAQAPAEVVAVEVNLSCPNLEGRNAIFAHDAELSAAVIAATEGAGRPRWAKLSANTDRIVEVAGAVHAAGAEAVTCINTLLGLAYDPTTGKPALGAGGGGLSGRAIHPVAVRAVHDVHAAHPELPIIGVGGVADGWDAEEFLLAGARAVQVGTATFADPKAAEHVLADLRRRQSPGG